MKATPSPHVERTARELAVELLTRVDRERSYSNLLLNQMLRKYKLERLEAAFATELVYGTIQRRNTIDYFLGRFVAKGLTKLEPWVRNLLRMSFYQLYYLDRVPPHAVVNEAVNIAKKKGHRGISGMVNGVLRNVLRQAEQLVLPEMKDPVQSIALRHSHPEWMVSRWVKQFGEETAERICEANNSAPSSSVRVQSLRSSREQMLDQLRAKGIEAAPSPLARDGIVVQQAGNMADSEEYRLGLLTIQDESSMLVADAVDPSPGMKVLDCCAAPGGKTTHLAERMNDEGEIIACDVHEHKEKLIREQADRLQLSCLHTIVTDARKLQEQYAPGTFDRILLDAPCSGLGVIRRKPDLKWAKSEAEIEEVVNVQSELLEAVHSLLKPGGILVYSTCTVEYNENEGQVRQFLERHPQFALSEFPQALTQLELPVSRRSKGMLQLLPQDYNSDGFFIARLQKLT
ncbi:16S rRNA (cytosine(967)-C(5))-methyltransferase RsmB [Paenibacillus sp. J2TS4]|uniref:16S rRNA (cytosine(967)-C(5))-methyltransferase RsmB n=1 Tax=Paenibacillus sp. J2TS4 TaxID=2807194 RepID=UPI001B18AC11|nr:16S rRNA (cytosine(967)-C(5))-methyltransferase RsmB [Paenibacillus sp. J2TS4]GIP32953.1 ribosomal RNA small subunit methyltransferase B [Paenibacillus sp. J2TS4]